VTTDEQGKATLSLPVGTWCLVSAAKRSLDAPRDNELAERFGRKIDPACVVEQQQTCDRVVQVEAGNKPVEVTYAMDDRCSCDPGPCYVGPRIPPPP